MTVCPAATRLGGTVSEIDVPDVFVPLAATCLTSAIAPTASDAGTRHITRRAASAANELVARLGRTSGQCAGLLISDSCYRKGHAAW